MWLKKPDFLPDFGVQVLHFHPIHIQFMSANRSPQKNASCGLPGAQNSWGLRKCHLSESGANTVETFLDDIFLMVNNCSYLLISYNYHGHIPIYDLMVNN